MIRQYRMIYFISDTASVSKICLEDANKSKLVNKKALLGP